MIQPLRIVVGAGLALAFAAPALAQVPAPALPLPPTAPQAIKPVKPGLYMVTGGGGNVSVRVTRSGLILVDGKNPGQSFHDDLMAQVRTVSDQPVKYLVVTHHHADHSGNIGRFQAAGVSVAGHSGLGPLLDKNVPPPGKPDTPYANRHTLTLGGVNVRLHHFQPAHTGADTIVHFPDLKVVAMGDELHAANPTFDYSAGASIDGWVKSIDATLKLDWDRAIPGHGAEPFTREQVIVFQGKLKTLIARAREQVKAGVPKDRLISSLKLDDLWTFPPTFWNALRTDGLYAEAGGK